MKVSKEVKTLLENLSCFLAEMSKVGVLEAERLQRASDKLKEKIGQMETEDE